MTRRIFLTRHFGTVSIKEEKYHNGALAILLVAAGGDFPGEPICKLSVNVPGRQLPPAHFFCKDWTENDLIIRDAARSGWFEPVLTIEPAMCGWEMSYVWKILDTQGAGFDYDQMLVGRV